MSRSNGKLRAEDLELLDMLGAAALDDTDFLPFEYLLLDGWPFAWLVHPRVVGEACVVDLETFTRLEEASCVTFTVDECEPPRRYAMLTHDGMTCYQRRHKPTGRDQRHQWHDDMAVGGG
jgi:hypothetical protein